MRICVRRLSNEFRSYAVFIGKNKEPYKSNLTSAHAKAIRKELLASKDVISDKKPS